MVKKCVLEGIIAGVLFALISWLGDKFIFDDEKSLLVYLCMGAFFAIGMGSFYYFRAKNVEDKKKEQK
jgi:thiamine transporter ThiT